MRETDITTLIESAARLGPFSDNTARSYRQLAPRLTALVNERMLKREDVLLLTGIENTDMMKDNHANHARFIASILDRFHPGVLTETIIWVFRAYRSRGFASAYWAAQLNAWIETIQDEMPAEAGREVLGLYYWMQVNIPLFDKLSQASEKTPDQIH